MAETKHVTYEDAGVDTAEGARAVDAIKEAVAATNRPEVIGGLGGFGSCFSAAALKDMEEPVLVSGTDGVGTKLAIAQLLDRHETVGESMPPRMLRQVVFPAPDAPRMTASSPLSTSRLAPSRALTLPEPVPKVLTTSLSSM